MPNGNYNNSNMIKITFNDLDYLSCSSSSLMLSRCKPSAVLQTVFDVGLG